MLPVFRRFSQGDFPESPNWLAQVFNPLNVFAETTVATLNRNLTIGQNVQGQKYSTSFTTPAGYAGGDFATISLTYTGGGQPNCLMLGQITNVDGTLITTPVTITDWFLNLNQSPFVITIGYIAGLTASTQYRATFIAL